ncbi:MFS transporter [Oceanobacillus sp. CFH 90083]|uniref:MFS transporter n=1 Tax=Oceanobacillus sp. CFH 90083 TaxID=2592336 RepID=UPI00128B2032|nr:MFS transporter [Oceanobacillus sp. CFH 90083]
MNSQQTSWKYPSILLTTIGIANVGEFMYFAAINIIVFRMTGSTAAVASLWVIGPIVNILTKFWTGSFIDYRSKRKIMISTYLIRAFFLFFIPFLNNIWAIYLILVFLSIAKSFFTPTSMTYIAQLVPRPIRKRYNSIQSLTNSSAFIIGPAITGALIMISDVHLPLFLNTAAFIAAAFLLLFLPDKDTFDKNQIPSLSFAQIKTDWISVIRFLKENSYIALVYAGFLATTVLGFAMDAQEVVFTQDVVGLSEVEYSLLLSITGIGAVTGGIFISIFSNYFSLRFLIAFGITLQTAGYIIYAFSFSFLTVTIGFIVLGFFSAFISAGINTFYQNNVPSDLMGRVTSMFQLLISAFQIVFVLTVGAIADIIPLRLTIIVLSFGMLFIAFLIIFSVFIPAKKAYFK